MRKIVLFLIIIIIFIFLISLVLNKKEPKTSIEYSTCMITDEVKYLSKKLNEAQKTLGRMSCKFSKNEISVRGGWCEELSGKFSIGHYTDIDLAKGLSNILTNQRVASFGDGPGEYKRLITEMNQVKIYDAFDGAPYAEETTNNSVKYLDLSVPIYHLPIYDWIISIEVAEHIPKKYEQIYIDNLVRHAKKGIIISWAILNQEGLGHVNNQNFPYIEEQLRTRDFILDNHTTSQIKNSTTFGWVKRNIYSFKRIKARTSNLK